MSNNSFCDRFINVTASGWCKCVCAEDIPDLCFKPTAPGNYSEADCPLIPITKSYGDGKAVKYCESNGTWSTNNKSNLSDDGYTNLSSCIIPKLGHLFEMCENFNITDGKQTCREFALSSSIIEIVGTTVSTVSLILSLYIFSNYRGLKNNRTKIHKNLFISLLLEAVVRLIYILDGFLSHLIIRKIFYLEVCVQILLEYAKTVMFMWMFIEGLYLNNMITVTVFQEHSYMKLYLIMGWTVPVVLTLIWILVMAIWCSRNWLYYSFLDFFWFLEGPRDFLLVINALFILNIIRVLVMKLREMNTNEKEQIKKAVRAAFFLIPLMGINNLVFLIDYHYDKAWKFQMWLYITAFFKTFGGFFVSLLYCFLNGEVQAVLKTSMCMIFPRRLRNYDQASTNVTGVSTAPEEYHTISRFNIPKSLLWCKHYEQSPEEKQIRICDLKDHTGADLGCQFGKAETYLLGENNTEMLLKRTSADGDTSSSNEETRCIL